MTFKTTTLIVVAIAMIMVALSSANSVDALPYWCLCGKSLKKTQSACRTAGGNWDGGSCGIDRPSTYTYFITACGKLNNSQVRCWGP
ncbi:hypothetical protein BGX23_005500 [Mortierella sp. AD031]|nr:hypothetical protein BGX23_005500 [Mortierella sp. AD031]KAG0203281.1 hypothetical protein BGX33_009221 [Mortierella sp. NVP41]